MQRNHLLLSFGVITCVAFTSCTKELPVAPRTTGTPPVARAGGDLVVFWPESKTTLDGTGSSDQDGRIVAYLWTAIAGPSPASISKTHESIAEANSLTKGTYLIELKVTDDAGLIGKDTVTIHVKDGDSLNAEPPIVISCDTRPVIQARLTPFGSLSAPRINLVGGTAGNKLVFAAGWVANAHSSRVDIYDLNTSTWSTAELTVPQRDGMAVASVGTKVMFAGGGDDDWIDVTSRVDIYDAATNSWSTAELSVPRNYLAAATVGNKVYFAGGGIWGPLYTGDNRNFHIGSTAIDIYDNSTNTWTTASLKTGRFELSATATGRKIFFAGGLESIYNGLSSVEILDTETGTWTYTDMHEIKAGHEGVEVPGGIMWVAGKKEPYQSGASLSKMAETKNVLTGAVQFDCVTPKTLFRTARKGDNIIFFTGRSGGVTDQFDIYNVSTKTWAIAKLPFNISGCALVSLNNTIYVAGGLVNGSPSNQVWTLDF